MKNAKNYLKLLVVIQLMFLVGMIITGIITRFEFFWVVLWKVEAIVVGAWLVTPFFLWLIDKWMD